VLGPRSLYDKLIRRRERDANRADKIWSTKQSSVAHLRSDVRIQLEQHQAQSQIAAGKPVIDKMVAAQAAMAEKAVAAWVQVATRLNDAALARWTARQQRRGHPAMTTPPVSAATGTGHTVHINGAAVPGVMTRGRPGRHRRPPSNRGPFTPSTP
jgi:hypothetical protein